MLHYKKDGTLDMRYASSKAYVAAQNSTPSYSSYERNDPPSYSPYQREEPPSYPSYSPYQREDPLDMVRKMMEQPFEPCYARAAVKSEPKPEPSQSSSSFVTDIIPNTDGTINRGSAAVRRGDIIVRADGKVDKRSAAVRQGRLILDLDGNPAWEVMGISRRVDDSISTNDIRSPASQRKYREESRSTHKDEKDVCHYMGLGVGLKCLESKPGVKPTVERLRSDLEPLNSALNYRMKLRSTNLGSDKDFDRRIIQILDGEDVPMTRGFAARINQIKDVLDSIPADQLNASLNHIKRVFNDKVVSRTKDW